MIKCSPTNRSKSWNWGFSTEADIVDTPPGDLLCLQDVQPRIELLQEVIIWDLGHPVALLHEGVTFQTLNTAYCIKTQLLLSPSQPMQDYDCWITAH